MPRLVLNGIEANVKPEAVEKYLAMGATMAPEMGSAENRVGLHPHAQVGRAALGLLPAAGGILGGFLGAPAGPPGIIGGAGLGAAGGEAWRQNLQRAAFGDEGLPETSMEAAGPIIGSGAGAAATAALPYGVPPVAGFVAKAARAPVLRHLPFARNVAGMASDVEKLGQKLLGGVASRTKPPTTTAPEVVPPAPTVSPLARVRAAVNKRANEGKAAREAAEVELEESMEAAGLKAADKTYWRKKFAAERAPKEQGKVVGEIKPAPKPAPRGAAGSARDRVQAISQRAKQPDERRTQRVFSESQGKKIDVETMHPSHVRSKINKIQKELEELGNRRAPVKESELEELLSELSRRMGRGMEHSAF